MFKKRDLKIIKKGKKYNRFHHYKSELIVKVKKVILNKF